jgi:N-acetylglutamate synthase-like GNAT family acetyltransferase
VEGMSEVVRFAQKEDTARVVTYLNEARLGTEGVAESIDYFLLMENEKREVTATIGIEPVGKFGLLRSLAISSALDQEMLLHLFNQALLLAKEKSLSTLILATNKPESVAFFQILGFALINKADLPQALIRNNHVQHIINVDNSVFMELTF